MTFETNPPTDDTDADPDVPNDPVPEQPQSEPGEDDASTAPEPPQEGDA